MFNDSLHEWPLTFCGLKCYCSFNKSQYANSKLKFQWILKTTLHTVCVSSDFKETHTYPPYKHKTASLKKTLNNRKVDKQLSTIRTIPSSINRLFPGLLNSSKTSLCFLPPVRSWYLEGKVRTSLRASGRGSHLAPAGRSGRE